MLDIILKVLTNGMVPLWIPLIGYIALIIVTGVYIYQWNTRRILNPEGKVFIKARALDLPVLSIEDPSTGRGRFILGDKDDEGSPVFMDDQFGIKIDPSFISGDASPTRYPFGLNIWHVGSTKSLPVSTNTVLAYQTMVRHRGDREEFRLLDFLPAVDLFSLLRSPREDLTHDAEIFIKQYRPKMEAEGVRIEITTDEFVKLLMQMQDYFTTLPLDKGTEYTVETIAHDLSQEIEERARFEEKRGFFSRLFRRNAAPKPKPKSRSRTKTKATVYYNFLCYYKAFQDLPYAHCAQDTARITYLLENLFWKKWQNKENFYKLVIMGILAVVAGAFAIYVASMAFGG